MKKDKSETSSSIVDKAKARIRCYMPFHIFNEAHIGLLCQEYTVNPGGEVEFLRQQIVPNY